MNLKKYLPVFRQKNIPPLAELWVDVHSHLLPAIDDGARDMEESILLLQGLEALGYKKVITTPHIMADTYCNTPAGIRVSLATLVSTAKEAGIKLEIEAAAEYYMDDGFLAQINAEDVLLIGGEYLLFETSYMAKPLQFDAMVQAILAAGHKPLLAHPERYRYIQDLKTEYRGLKEKGIYFQVNLNSFGGHYGKEAKIKANFLNKQGMIDFLGSDVHHKRQVETLWKIKTKRVYQRLFENNSLLNNTL